jgi:ribosomal protein L11 methyltransferase
MDYRKYSLHTDADTAQLLLAFLSDSAFDTFQETDEGLDAFAPASADPADIEAQLVDLQAQFPFTWDSAYLPAQNWNALWESNFQPVIVGDFCAVRADFHPPQAGVRWELRINPKMAFGTGHHETTWQCIAAMEHLPIAGKKILDYGCGTGILAILAAKLGAAELEAVDIEAESYRNTLENAEANGTPGIAVRCGTLEAVQGQDFDGILANINRHIILESLPELARRCRPGGWLLVSGILEQDEPVVLPAAEAAGFVRRGQTQRGRWLCVHLQKN